MELHQLLQFAVASRASDVHIQANLPPCVRIDGQVHAVNLPAVTNDELLQLIASMAPAEVRDNLNKHLFEGLDFSYTAPNLGRFRCAVYRHLGLAGMVMRVVLDRIPTVAELNLPEILREIVLSRRGLTLVAGTTGAGKSTTLAALTELINENLPGKILYIADPIEFVHTPKLSMITHMEVGLDTPSFEQALRHGLRENPDVIIIGELRDGETLRTALRAADTGHQVMATVHSANAAQCVDRIIALLPPSEQRLLLSQFAGTLHAVIAQRLINCRDGVRRPVVEILRGGPVTSKYILEGKISEMADYIQTGGDGQQSFDQELLALFRKELLSAPDAIHSATNPKGMQIAIRGLSYSLTPPEATEAPAEALPQKPEELPLQDEPEPKELETADPTQGSQESFLQELGIEPEMNQAEPLEERDLA